MLNFVVYKKFITTVVATRTRSDIVFCQHTLRHSILYRSDIVLRRRSTLPTLLYRFYFYRFYLAGVCPHVLEANRDASCAQLGQGPDVALYDRLVLPRRPRADCGADCDLRVREDEQRLALRGGRNAFMFVMSSSSCGMYLQEHIDSCRNMHTNGLRGRADVRGVRSVVITRASVLLAPLLRPGCCLRTEPCVDHTFALWSVETFGTP